MSIEYFCGNKIFFRYLLGEGSLQNWTVFGAQLYAFWGFLKVNVQDGLSFFPFFFLGGGGVLKFHFFFGGGGYA